MDTGLVSSKKKQIAKCASLIAATLDEVSGDRAPLTYDALNALGKLEPEALVQSASSVAARLQTR